MSEALLRVKDKLEDVRHGNNRAVGAQRGVLADRPAQMTGSVFPLLVSAVRPEVARQASPTRKPFMPEHLPVAQAPQTSGHAQDPAHSPMSWVRLTDTASEIASGWPGQARGQRGVAVSDVNTAWVSTTRQPTDPRVYSESVTVMTGFGSVSTYTLMFGPDASTVTRCEPPGSR